MSHDIPSIEEFIENLEKNGLGTYASAIKEAFQSINPSFGVGSRPGVPRYKTVQGPTSVVPKEPGMPFAQPGEEVLEIGPGGKTTEKRYRWPERGTPLTMPQLVDYMNKGMFDVDFLKDEMTKADTPEKKQHIQGLLNMARKNQRLMTAAERLLELSQKTKSIGKDDVAERLQEAAQDLVSAGTAERHSVASLEEVFEKSKSSPDWAKNLKKALNVYSGAAGVIQLFVAAYKKKAKELVDKGIQDTEELKKLVREADASISSKFSELDKELSQ